MTGYWVEYGDRAERLAASDEQTAWWVAQQRWPHLGEPEDIERVRPLERLSVGDEQFVIEAVAAGMCNQIEAEKLETLLSPYIEKMQRRKL